MATIRGFQNRNDAISRKKFRLTHYLPVLNWGRNYKKEWLAGDLLAGLIVTIMLVPQGMAYAMLAGLPPQVGLYASILPLILYGLLGTSRVLAVGPVAIVSLLGASGISQFAVSGTADYMQLALTLALLVGIIQALMGLLRAGFLVNFLSHPILAGFTSAAALVIGFSQLKHLLGIDMPRLEFFETIGYTIDHAGETEPAPFLIGAAGIAILLIFKFMLGGQLKKLRIPLRIATPLTKSGPLVIVLLGTAAVMLLRLHEGSGIKVVGQVPAGLPSLTMPILDLETWQMLLPTALVISFVGYMESISVAKSLACKKREQVDSNQELMALGAANFGAALTGGYPVTGGFSRTVVNYDAGANTGLASMITALMIALTVIFLTPLFYFLPQAVLAAIIIVAVLGLIDLKTFKHVWKYNKADAAAMIATFLAVLAIGIEKGILVGVGVTMFLFIWRTSQPHVAVVGRLGDSEIYRNIKRYPVQTCPKAMAVRIDESLYFANTKYLEDTVLDYVAENNNLEHFILIGTAINFIDASALETLESLHRELGDAGVTFHLAAIKGPVMDRLIDIGFVEQFGAGNIHLSTHDAMKAVGCVNP